MDALTFAMSMEKSIADILKSHRIGCSPELSRVVDLLLGFHVEFERLIIGANALAEGQAWPEIRAVSFVGNEEIWRDLTGSINPGLPPLVSDYTTLWSIHALIDKSAQFYQQAAKQSLLEQERIFFSSVAELKLILHRRIDGVERVVANQVWKTVGFPPGLLGK